MEKGEFNLEGLGLVPKMLVGPAKYKCTNVTYELDRSNDYDVVTVITIYHTACSLRSAFSYSLSYLYNIDGQTGVVPFVS